MPRSPAASSPRRSRWRPSYSSRRSSRRALGPADFGRFSVLLTIVTLGSLALTLGGPTLMARFVPAAPPHERVALARAIGARLTRGRAAQLVAIGLAAFVATVVSPEHVPALECALVFCALALNVGTSLTLQVALGLGITGPWTVRYPLQNAVLIVAVLVLYPLAGIDGAAIAILVSAAVGAVFAVVVVVPRIRGRTHRWRFRPARSVSGSCRQREPRWCSSHSAAACSRWH